MTRIIFAFVLLAGYFSAQAQVAPGSVYLLYSSQNMDILDYRMAFSNNATAYYAYSFKPSATELFVLYTGAGVYADYLPSGAQTSRDFKLTDDLMTGVNNVSRQFFVVQQQQRGYVVSPVVSVTKIVKSGNYSLVNAAAYSFILDTDNVMMGREMSSAGSRSSVVLNTFGYRNCKYQYSFRRVGNAAGSEAAEFDFIPGIGVTSDKSGKTAAEMQQNQVVLWAVNGMPLDDYIKKECGVAATTPAPAVPSAQAATGPRLGDPATGSVIPAPVTTPPPAGNGIVSAISNYPAVDCGKTAAVGFHQVQPKETVNSIARFYGVTAAQIIKWNNIKDPNKISICQELRITAPGTQPKKQLQAIKGSTAKTVATPTGPVITPPPAAPATTPVYQPTQPAPATALPDLFNVGPAPAVYSTPQPVAATMVPVAAAPAAATVRVPGQAGQYYAVQPGEGVYVIAKKFGYTDERFRTMNNLPTTGNVPLQVGQLLRVSDCDAPVTTFSTGIPATTPAGATPAPVITTPAPVTTTPATYSTPAQPGTTPGFVPIGSPGEQPVLTTPEPAKVATKREPIGFKDYFVRDSETIKDIARKQKLDAAELSLINGRDQNEVLAPGTRLQLPIY